MQLRYSEGTEAVWLPFRMIIPDGFWWSWWMNKIITHFNWIQFYKILQYNLFSLFVLKCHVPWEFLVVFLEGLSPLYEPFLSTSSTEKIHSKAFHSVDYCWPAFSAVLCYFYQSTTYSLSAKILTISTNWTCLYHTVTEFLEQKIFQWYKWESRRRCDCCLVSLS